MNDELKAAAKRYSDWRDGDLSGNDRAAYYEDQYTTDADALCDWAASHIAADEAERAEREKPIDEEWLRSLSGGEWNWCFSRGAMSLRVWRSRNFASGWGWSISDKDDGYEDVHPLSTRGQLLDLLRALGVEVKA